MGDGNQSLAIALYFASKGVGTIRETPESLRKLYTCPAKVLLNGLGPDELLGGYGRYKTVFSQYGGWPRVVEEVVALLDHSGRPPGDI